MNRRRRGRELYAATWSVLRADRRLLVWPGISVLCSIGLSALAFLVAAQVVDPHAHARLGMTLAIVIAGYPVALATFFCGVALAGTLNEVLEGRPADPRVGWALARRRFGVIVAWSVVVATIGAILRVLEERVPLGGKIAALVLDLGWSVATLFAVPSLAFEGRMPRATLQSSARLVRERFGAAVGGTLATAGISLVALFLVGAILGLGAAVAGGAGIIILAIGIAAAFGVGAWTVAVDHAYRVILYADTTGRLVASGPGMAALLNPDAPWMAPDGSTRPLWRATPSRGRAPLFSKDPEDYR